MKIIEFDENSMGFQETWWPDRSRQDERARLARAARALGALAGEHPGAPQQAEIAREVRTAESVIALAVPSQVSRYSSSTFAVLAVQFGCTSVSYVHHTTCSDFFTLCYTL